jgi:hypothetical protein
MSSSPENCLHVSLSMICCTSGSTSDKGAYSGAFLSACCLEKRKKAVDIISQMPEWKPWPYREKRSWSDERQKDGVQRCIWRSKTFGSCAVFEIFRPRSTVLDIHRFGQSKGDHRRCTHVSEIAWNPRIIYAGQGNGFIDWPIRMPIRSLPYMGRVYLTSTCSCFHSVGCFACSCSVYCDPFLSLR